MRITSKLALFAALAGWSGAIAAAEPDDRFSGRFGHASSEPAYEPVWEVQRAGNGWRAANVVDGEYTDAHRLSAAGRAAFWTKMHWPADTSVDADCLSWGERPPDLMDLVADAPPPDARDAYGYAVLCHLPTGAREAIDWLADGPDDWFYYDPMMGVMGVRHLR